LSITTYIGGAVVDAAGTAAAPGMVAVRHREADDPSDAAMNTVILAAGEIDKVKAMLGQPSAELRIVERPHALLLPGLVNAHSHLDLTDVGPQPFGGNFLQWIGKIRALRRDADYNVAHAVTLGAAASRAAGVLTVGDIAGWAAPGLVRRALAASPLRGVSFVELLGFAGEPRAEAERQLLRLDTAADEQLDGRGGLRVGLQPHAPYSTAFEVYRQAVDLAVRRGLPLSTHLAETLDEQQFVSGATGPFRDFLEAIGQWSAGLESAYGRGSRPVAWLEPLLTRGRWLIAHANYVGDAEIARLAEFGVSVAYCPRASEYFGHHDHPYRRMLEAGVNVCLGTDSIICHGSLSILAEMRRLRRRDGVDPRTLLAMGTTHGAQALGYDPREATLLPGAEGGVIAVDYDGLTIAEPWSSWAALLDADGEPRIEVLCDAAEPSDPKITPESPTKASES
jgi:cytosine/adenosine deaminase-related metal-dependent hydrolase